MSNRIKSFIEGLKGNNRTAVVKKNIIGSFGVKGVSILISLILVPLTIGYVSSELYGIWLTLATVVSWAALFDLGFANGLRNKVTECVALNNWEKARKYISTAYFYFSAIFVPLALLVFFTCPFVNWTSLLNVDAGYQDLLVDVMRIVIIFFSLSMIVNIQGTVLQALQLNAVSNAVSAVGQMLVLLVVFSLTKTTQPSLIYLAFSISGSPIIITLISSCWLYGHKFKQLAPSIKLIDTTLVKDIMTLGLNFFILQIAFIVLYQTMNIIISNTSGPDAVTEYNVVYKFISVPMMAATIIIAPFWSATTDAYTIKDFAWMRRSYNKLLRLFLFGIAALVLMVVISPVFFRIWLGDKVTVHITMTVIVAFYVAIMMWNNMHSAIINGTGLLKIQMLSCIVSTIVNIPLALLAGYHYGAIGVVFTVAVLSMAGSVLMHIQVKKIINNNARGIWAK